MNTPIKMPAVKAARPTSVKASKMSDPLSDVKAAGYNPKTDVLTPDGAMNKVAYQRITSTPISTKGQDVKSVKVVKPTFTRK